MVIKMDSIQKTDKNTAQAAAFQRERLSALADGQLYGDDLTETLALLDDADTGGQVRATWHALHVVGDVLRAHEVVSYRKDVDFLTRFSNALQQEPNLAAGAPALAASSLSSVYVPMAPVEAIPAIPLPSSQPEVANIAKGGMKDSANDAVFSWKWVAGLSSVAAAVAISWNLVGGAVATSGAQLAQAVNPAVPLGLQAVPAASGNEVMLRSPQLDAMIAAHSQLGGSSALQMPSGFLRNATFDATLNPAPNGVAR